MLEGIELSGGAFSREDIEFLDHRLRTVQRRPKLSRSIIDTAFLTRAGELKERMAQVCSGNGLDMSAEELLTLAESHPDLFQAAMRPSCNPYSNEPYDYQKNRVSGALSAYFRYSTRFKPTANTA